MDRVLELAKSAGLKRVDPGLDAYAIITDTTALPQVLATLQKLRAAGVRVQMHASTGDAMGSMKSQFKRADSSGARFALVFGPDEMSEQRVTIKHLRDTAVPQQTQSLNTVTTWAATLQSVA